MALRRLRVLFGLLALLVTTAVTVAVAPASGAITYPPASIETKPVTQPNGSMTLTGVGFTPGATVQVSLDGAPIGTTTAAPDGTFTFNFTAPAKVGPYQISANDGTNNLTTTFRVETGGGGGGGGLPYTGTSSTPWLIRIGIGLLAVGGVFLALVRSPARRREADRARVDA